MKKKHVGNDYNNTKSESVQSNQNDSNDHNNMELENIQFNQNDSKEIIKNINCNICSGNIKIEEGDEFSVKAENVRKGICKINIQQDTLNIKYNYKNELKVFDTTAEIPENFTIVIPKNIELKNVNIDLGVGNIIDNTKSMNVENTILDAGCAKITSNNINSKNFKVDIGSGELNLAGTIEKLVHIDGGTVKAALKINDIDISEYNLQCDIGVGNISINNKSYGSEYESEADEGDKKIIVELGTGNIDINN